MAVGEDEGIRDAETEDTLQDSGYNLVKRGDGYAQKGKRSGGVSLGLGRRRRLGEGRGGEWGERRRRGSRFGRGGGGQTLVFLMLVFVGKKGREGESERGRQKLGRLGRGGGFVKKRASTAVPLSCSVHWSRLDLR